MISLLFISVPIIFGLFIGTYFYFLKEYEKGTNILKKSIFQGLTMAFLIFLIELIAFLAYEIDGFHIYEDPQGIKDIFSFMVVSFLILFVLFLIMIRSEKTLILWIIIVLWTFTNFVLSCCIERSYQENILDSMDYYIVGTKTTYLEPMKDNKYISSTIGSDEISYQTKGENEDFISFSLLYNKENYDIIMDDFEIPRIKTTTYEKKLFDITGNERIKDSYSEIVIYIPKDGYIIEE